MLRKQNLVILIPSTLLILIFFGVPPLNMAYRLAGGVPFAHGKQAHLVNHCPFTPYLRSSKCRNFKLSSTASRIDSITARNYSEVLAEKIKEGKLSFPYPVPETTAVDDAEGDGPIDAPYDQ